MPERIYNIVMILLFVALNSPARADMTSTTVTPHSTITITQTPTHTITTITTPSSHLPAPAVAAPLVPSQSPPAAVAPVPTQPAQPAPAAPVPFMPPQTAPTTPPQPKVVPQRPSIYPKYQNDCHPCAPDPSNYYPRVPADRVSRSTASCNGVGC